MVYIERAQVTTAPEGGHRREQAQSGTLTEHAPRRTCSSKVPLSGAGIQPASLLLATCSSREQLWRRLCPREHTQPSPTWDTRPLCLREDSRVPESRGCPHTARSRGKSSHTHTTPGHTYWGVTKSRGSFTLVCLLRTSSNQQHSFRALGEPRLSSQTRPSPGPPSAASGVATSACSQRKPS